MITILFSHSLSLVTIECRKVKSTEFVILEASQLPCCFSHYIIYPGPPPGPGIIPGTHLHFIDLKQNTNSGDRKIYKFIVTRTLATFVKNKIFYPIQ